MKTLLILRHAKSSWANPGLDDFDRPLNKRGREAAPLMADYLTAQGLSPDLVLCSAARRTLETWDLVSRRLEPEPPVKQLRSLYLASSTRILQAVQRAPGDAARILVIGHNPGMERLAAQLAGPGSSGPALDDLQTKFPTAALAVMTADVAGWRDLAFGRARLTAFVKPRDLAGADGTHRPPRKGARQ